MSQHIDTQTQLLINDANDAIEAFFSRDPLTQKLIPIFKDNFQMAMDDHIPDMLEKLENENITDEQKWQRIEAETPIWGIDSHDALDSGFINEEDVNNFIERYKIPETFLKKHGYFYAIDHVTITYYDALIRNLLHTRQAGISSTGLKELVATVEDDTEISW